MNPFSCLLSASFFFSSYGWWRWWKIDSSTSAFISTSQPFFNLYFILQLYKGRLENGTQVAIRCLPLSKKYTIRNLKLRLDLIARLRHTHLVCLLGHGIDTGGQDDSSVYKVFLIYEYLPNGNFRSHLSGMSTSFKSTGIYFADPIWFIWNTIDCL